MLNFLTNCKLNLNNCNKLMNEFSLKADFS